jgi:hypothetical protein
MNMSEILTRVDSLSDRSRLVTRSVEREETPVLTLSILQSEAAKCLTHSFRHS